MNCRLPKLSENVQAAAHFVAVSSVRDSGAVAKKRMASSLAWYASSLAVSARL